MYVFERSFSNRMFAWTRLMAFAGLIAAAIALPPDCRAGSPEASPDEMLTDGLDALSEGQQDLATKLFEQVILGFPGTDQSLRAERELGALNASAKPAHATSTPQRDTRDVNGPLRLKFATDAGDRVFFAENSAAIGSRARALIENQARWLTARPDVHVTVIGRSDDGGPKEAALELSSQRAAAVRDKLIASGIPAGRVRAEGRGTDDAIATCELPICKAQNRHAETSLDVPVPGRDKLGNTSDAGRLTRGRNAMDRNAMDTAGATVSR